MKVREAKDVARRWVEEEAGALPGFRGARLGGSINWLPDDAELPATSDVDLLVVLDDPDQRGRAGKFPHAGLILEVSYTTLEQLGTAEEILGNFQRAGGFRWPGAIADPTGRLTELHRAVARDFAKRAWVRRRCEHARDHSLRYANAWKDSPPYPDSVSAWLFATGVTCSLLLTAGLRNPTVRLRYEKTRELLAEYGRLDFYEALLEQLGCAQWTAQRAADHLAALEEAFDAAKAVAHTPFFFSGDITDAARPIAIDGSRELIERGDHREAVFWLVATYARCMKVLHADGTAEQRERYDRGLWRLLGDVGIASPDDLRTRSEGVEAFMPRVWDVAEQIMAANEAIEEGSA